MSPDIGVGFKQIDMRGKKLAESFDKLPIVKTARGENTAVIGVVESVTLPPSLKRTG